MSARGVLQHRLPRLLDKISLHQQIYVGPLECWETFTSWLQELRRSRHPGTSYETVLSTACINEDTALYASSEISVSHRVFEHILQPVGKVLKVTHPELQVYFADRKVLRDDAVEWYLQGACDQRRAIALAAEPDVVGCLSSLAGTQINPSEVKDGQRKQAHGEIKHPYYSVHDVVEQCHEWEDSGFDNRHWKGVRQILGQPLENMIAHGHDWGWWTTYAGTIWFRPDGRKVLVSRPIPHDTESGEHSFSVKEALYLLYRETFIGSLNFGSQLSITQHIDDVTKVSGHYQRRKRRVAEKPRMSPEKRRKGEDRSK